MRLKKVKYNLVVLIVVLVYFSSISQVTVSIPSDKYDECIKMEEEYEQLKMDYLQLQADTASFMKAWRKNEEQTSKRVERMLKDEKFARKKLVKEHQRSQEKLIEEYEKKMANLQIGFEVEKKRMRMSQKASDIEIQQKLDSAAYLLAENERLLIDNYKLRKRITKNKADLYRLREEVVSAAEYADLVSIVIKESTTDIRRITSSSSFSSPNEALEAAIDRLENLVSSPKETKISYDESDLSSFKNKVFSEARKVLANDYDRASLDKVLQALQDISELSSNSGTLAEVRKYQELLEMYCKTYNESFDLVKITNSYASSDLRKRHIEMYMQRYNITSETYAFLYKRLQEKLNSINDATSNPFKVVSCN